MISRCGTLWMSRHELLEEFLAPLREFNRHMPSIPTRSSGRSISPDFPDRLKPTNGFARQP